MTLIFHTCLRHFQVHTVVVVVFFSKTTLQRFSVNETLVGKVCYITPSLHVSEVNFFAMLMHALKSVAPLVCSQRMLLEVASSTLN